MAPHIIVDISAHGFGHAAMTLPVLSALKALRPDVRLTVRSGLAHAWLQARADVLFDYVCDPDFGLVMENSLRVCERASLDRYAELHRDWPKAVATAADALAGLKADLLVSNIPYLSLAAAGAIGLPCVAYSSLNWADVFLAYCGDLPGAPAIAAQMAEAYGAADVFLQPEPSMIMPSIGNGQATRPVVRLGENRRDEVAGKLGLSADTAILLLSLGGIPSPIDYSRWPRLPGWRVVIGSNEAADHPDVSSWTELGMPFRDALASANVLVVKPGYGLITEGVFNGKPMLYVPRDGWPETGPQLDWLQRLGTGEPVAEEMLARGAFLPAAERLRETPVAKPPPPGGAFEVAQAVLARL